MALPDSLTSRHFHWEVLPRLRIGRLAADATDAADATCSGDARLVLPETAGDSWNGSLAKWAGEKRGSRLSRHWVLVICLHCRLVGMIYIELPIFIIWNAIALYAYTLGLNDPRFLDVFS